MFNFQYYVTNYSILSKHSIVNIYYYVRRVVTMKTAAFESYHIYKINADVNIILVIFLIDSLAISAAN